MQIEHGFKIKNVSYKNGMITNTQGCKETGP